MQQYFWAVLSRRFVPVFTVLNITLILFLKIALTIHLLSLIHISYARNWPPRRIADLGVLNERMTLEEIKYCSRGRDRWLVNHAFEVLVNDSCLTENEWLENTACELYSNGTHYWIHSTIWKLWNCSLEGLSVVKLRSFFFWNDMRLCLPLRRDADPALKKVQICGWTWFGSQFMNIPAHPVRICLVTILNLNCIIMFVNCAARLSYFSHFLWS